MTSQRHTPRDNRQQTTSRIRTIVQRGLEASSPLVAQRCPRQPGSTRPAAFEAPTRIVRAAFKESMLHKGDPVKAGVQSLAFGPATCTANQRHVLLALSGESSAGWPPAWRCASLASAGAGAFCAGAGAGTLVPMAEGSCRGTASNQALGVQGAGAEAMASGRRGRMLASLAFRRCALHGEGGAALLNVRGSRVDFLVEAPPRTL
ncbi:hypothetical protein DFJ74DRAFT_72667 [Hyaloraphidium curvatum]|nr:hypothetical protein DFJ74DRAFT_72667 [Hyaloraphidium curvatum]